MVDDGEALRIGDQVLVPWGLDEMEGEISEIYSTGLGPRARVILGGELDGETVVLPLDSLRPKAFAATDNWRSAEDYERRVGAALERSIPPLSAKWRYAPSPDRGADFELSLGNRRVFVEAKYYNARQRVPTDAVLTVAGLADSVTGALLISNVPLAPAANQRLERLWQLRTLARFVQWRGQRDDLELQAALRMFV